jgi:hypothetical protein
MTPAGQPTSESDPPPNPGPSSPNEPGGIFTANLTPYDACYVTLARNLGCPLVTGDRRLARAPGLGVPLITV